MSSLTMEIAGLLKDIQERRGQIKEDFIRAWLATLPPSEVEMDWIIKNVEMVERWSSDRLTVTWSLRTKKDYP